MSDFINIPVEIRQDEKDKQSPGRLTGVLMAYGQGASDRREEFMPGSLEWPEGGIVLNEQHNRQAPIMRVIPEIRGDNIVIDSPLPDTQRGRDMAVMIRNKTLTGLSIEFRAITDRIVNGVRKISKAALLGAGLVDCPSYEAAKVAVRNKQIHRRRPWL